MFLKMCEMLRAKSAFAKNTWPADFDGGSCNTSIDFHNRTAAIQFRYYLWRLFREYWQRFLASSHTLPIDQFAWYFVLKHLIWVYELTLVSYNYDFLIESMLWDIKCHTIHPIVDCVAQMRKRKENDVVVLKPHGCISHAYPIGGAEGAGLCIVVNSKIETYSVNYNLSDCPSIPDIVPPGHDEAHLANADSDVAQATGLAFEHADILVICGFSSSGPDAIELEGLLRRSKQIPCVHVGLMRFSDHKGTTATLLKRYSSNYQFVDAGSVGLVPSLLDTI